MCEVDDHAGDVVSPSGHLRVPTARADRDDLLAGTRGRLSGGQLSHLLVLHDIPDPIGGEHDDSVLIIQLARGDLRYRDQIRMNLRARVRVHEAAGE